MGNKSTTFDQATAERILSTVRDVEQTPMRQSCVRRRRRDSAIPQAGGETACPAKFTGKEETLYTIDLYGNGLQSTKTGTAKMEVLEIHLEDSIPVGTAVLAHPANFSITSGWGPL